MLSLICLSPESQLGEASVQDKPVPRMYDESSEARNTTAFATSSEFPNRFMGFCSRVHRILPPLLSS